MLRLVKTKVDAQPKQEHYDRRRKLEVFECAICDDCGRVAVAGKKWMESLSLQTALTILKLSITFSETVEISTWIWMRKTKMTPEEIGKNDYILCSKCGAPYS